MYEKKNVSSVDFDTNFVFKEYLLSFKLLSFNNKYYLSFIQRRMNVLEKFFILILNH